MLLTNGLAYTQDDDIIDDDEDEGCKRNTYRYFSIPTSIAQKDNKDDNEDDDANKGCKRNSYRYFIISTSIAQESNPTIKQPSIHWVSMMTIFPIRDTSEKSNIR